MDPFIKNPLSLTPSTIERAQEAKMRLETFYTSLVQETQERESRKKNLLNVIKDYTPDMKY
jgi:hypothetical protein